MQLPSTPIHLSRPMTSTEMERAFAGAVAISNVQPSDVGTGLAVAGALAAPFEAWDVGKAAFGGGQAGGALQVAGGLHTVVNGYQAVRGLFSKVTPQAISDALKGQNGGKDLDPGDASMLADHINGRAHLNSAIELGNAVACGTAIATGNMAAGIVALVLKGVTTGAAFYTAAQTVKDVQTVLHGQLPPA